MLTNLYTRWVADLGPRELEQLRTDLTITKAVSAYERVLEARSRRAGFVGGVAARSQQRQRDAFRFYVENNIERHRDYTISVPVPYGIQRWGPVLPENDHRFAGQPLPEHLQFAGTFWGPDDNFNQLPVRAAIDRHFPGGGGAAAADPSPAGSGVGGTVVMPTGGGKTICLVYTLFRIRRKALVVLTSSSLLSDMRKVALPRHLPGARVAVLPASGGLPDPSTFDVAVTLLGRLAARADLGDWLSWCGAVIFDEMHHVGAQTLHRAVTNAAQVRFLVGFSATPNRRDGMECIYPLFLGPPIFSAPPGSTRRVFYTDILPVQLHCGANQLVRKPMPGCGPADTQIDAVATNGLLADDPVRNACLVHLLRKLLRAGRNTLVFVSLLRHVPILMRGLLQSLVHDAVADGAASLPTAMVDMIVAYLDLPAETHPGESGAGSEAEAGRRKGRSKAKRGAAAAAAAAAADPGAEWVTHPRAGVDVRVRRDFMVHYAKPPLRVDADFEFVREHRHRIVFATPKMLGEGVNFAYADAILDEGSIGAEPNTLSQVVGRFRYRGGREAGLPNGLRFLLVAFTSMFGNYPKHWEDRRKAWDHEGSILQPEVYRTRRWANASENPPSPAWTAVPRRNVDRPAAPLLSGAGRGRGGTPRRTASQAARPVASPKARRARRAPPKTQQLRAGSRPPPPPAPTPRGESCPSIAEAMYQLAASLNAP